MKKNNHKPVGAQQVGAGGETHQTAGVSGQPLTTNQGIAIADDHDQMEVGVVDAGGSQDRTWDGCRGAPHFD